MKFTKEIKVALVAIVALIVLFFGLNFLKGLSLFNNDTEYRVAFDNVSGLSSSSPIYADGYRVGTVKSVDFNYEKKDKILVTVGLNPSLRVPKGSSAEIVSDMLGNVQLNLLLANNPRERVEPGEVIMGTVNSGLMSKASELVPAIEKLMPKLDSILTNLNLILGNPAINRSLANIEQISGDLTTTTVELNKLMANVNNQLPSVLEKANGTMGNAQELSGNLKQQLANIDLQETMTRVNNTLDNVEKLTAKLNSTEGTLGLMMNDPQFYNHLNTTMSNVDSLLINLREHPKRYVHFSLFGKKDK